MTLSIINLCAGAWITFYNIIINNCIFTNNSSKHYNFGLFLIFSFFHAMNLEFCNPLLQVIVHILLIYLFTIFNSHSENNLIIPSIIIIYSIRFIFELLFILVLSFFKIPLPSSQTLIFITATLAIIFTFTFKEYIIKIIKFKKIFHRYYFSDIIIINIFLFIIIFLRLIIYWHNGVNVNFTDLGISIVIINLCFILMEEKFKVKSYIDHYQKLVEYSQTTEELLTKYKSSMHEIKNQLIIIQGLAKDNQELYDYVNFILNEKNKCDYHWLSFIKNIPISGLKGLINYKILKMQEQKLNFEVYVSDDVQNYQNLNFNITQKNDLYTLLGIFLDNAIEASLESQEKMISLQIYLENNKLIFLIANTFKNVNLERIYEKGYSSKDKNRGIGLYLANSIINKSSKFENITKIEQNFFTQKLLVKLN